MKQHLIEKRLGFITDCVADIRRLGDVANLRADKVQQRFLEHTLQLAVQAMLDAAFAIASEHNLGEPGSNRQVFQGLVQAGWITEGVAATCRRMVAFRNVVVHRYLEVDLSILQAIVERHLDDLLAFVRAVRDKQHAGD
jgi:uncharacterized protein YutE (UPF0331/DUF86 family)